MTDIRKENIHYCKELMKFKHLELRHLDGLTLNFGVGDGRDCTIHLADKEAESVTSLLYATAKPIVETQQHLFDTLWNKAIFAEERIKDIEDEIKPGFTQTFENRYEIQKKVLELISSAKKEILAIFSTTSIAYNSHLAKDERQGEKTNGVQDEIELLNQAALRGINIRIIAQDNNPIIRELSQQVPRKELSSEQRSTVQIRSFQPHLQIKISTTIVVDQKESLVIELIDDQKTTEPFSKSAAMSALYSSNEHTVSSYISIFETLWMKEYPYCH